jgi:hypothetical protein
VADPAAGWAAPTLMRVPFLFAAGVFFGYVVLPERTGEMTPLKRGGATVLTRRPPMSAALAGG